VRFFPLIIVRLDEYVYDIAFTLLHYRMARTVSISYDVAFLRHARYSDADSTCAPTLSA